jgi:uncharacterized protein involved in exopolysaccharide biosynthesis
VKERDTVSDAEGERSHLTVASWLADTILRWRIIAVTLLVMLIAAGLAVAFIPPVYRSRVSFVANSAGGSRIPSGLAANGALAGLASQLGMASGADPTESPNFYMQLIQSRELLTRLLQSKFRDPRGESPRDSATLLQIMHLRGSDPARKMEIGLKQIGKSINGKYDNTTNVVWLDVDAEWPALSAAIANRTIDLVSSFNNEQRVTRVRAKRTFLEGRVANAKSELAVAEEQLRQFDEQNRSWRSSPSLVFQEEHLQREVDRTMELYVQLQRQLETTLLEEVNDAPRISVIDSAIPPRKAEWPRYGVLLMSTVISGLFLGFILAGGAAILADWRTRNPSSTNYLSAAIRSTKSEIVNALRLRSSRSR